MEAVDPRPAPGPDCTCWWTVTPTSRSIWIADDTCPSRPHVRTQDLVPGNVAPQGAAGPTPTDTSQPCPARDVATPGFPQPDGGVVGVSSVPGREGAPHGAGAPGPGPQSAGPRAGVAAPESCVPEEVSRGAGGPAGSDDAGGGGIRP